MKIIAWLKKQWLKPEQAEPAEVKLQPSPKTQPEQAEPAEVKLQPSPKPQIGKKALERKRRKRAAMAEKRRFELEKSQRSPIQPPIKKQQRHKQSTSLIDLSKMTPSEKRKHAFKTISSQWKRAFNTKDIIPYALIESGPTKNPCPLHSHEHGNIYLIEESLWDNLISEFRGNELCKCRFRIMTKRDAINKGYL